MPQTTIVHASTATPAYHGGGACPPADTASPNADATAKLIHAPSANTSLCAKLMNWRIP